MTPEANRPLRHGLVWLVLGLLVVAAVAACTIASIAPTEVRGVDAPATEFSAARALRHVEAIAKTPHPVGSPAHEEVRAYLLRVLAELGLEVRVEETDAALKAAAVVHAAKVKNVIARLPGTRPGPAVLLAAHYDSVPQSRGASDDGSGVATLLETARALTAGPRLPNDVVFLFTDAEELAACGALAFTRDELAAHPIGVALNFEARGTRGAVALYDTSDDNGTLVRAVAAVAPRVVSTSLLGSLARALPNDSDATIWKRAGIPTYAFAYVDHLYQYHQYTDSLEALDPRSLQHDGDYALPLVRELGSRALPLPVAPSLTYFDVLGRTVVTYSTLVARVLALLTLGLFVVLVRRTRRAATLTTRSVLAGFAIALGALAAAGLAAGAVHLVLGAVVDHFILFAYPGVATAAGLLLGTAALLFVYALALRGRDAASTVVGALSFWALLLLVTGALVPAASFVFQWPLLFALVGAVVFQARRDDPGAFVDCALVALLVPASFFWSNLAYTLFVMVGGRAPEAVVVAVAAATLLALPLLARAGAPAIQRAAGVVAALSLVVTVVGWIQIHASPDLPRPDNLTYGIEPAKHGARWSTTDKAPDAFVRQHVRAGQLSAKATVYDLAPLETTVHAVDEDGAHHATLHVASPRRARCVRFWELTHEPILKARVNDRDVVEIVRFSPKIDDAIANYFLGGGHASAWVMEYCGADETGFKLDLFSPAGKPVKLRIIELSDGFPGPPPTPRTPADGYPDTDSDVTMAMVDVTL